MKCECVCVWRAQLKQAEGHSRDSQRVELRREISELQNELRHIEQKISTAEEQLANEGKDSLETLYSLRHHLYRMEVIDDKDLFGTWRFFSYFLIYLFCLLL